MNPGRKLLRACIAPSPTSILSLGPEEKRDALNSFFSGLNPAGQA